MSKTLIYAGIGSRQTPEPVLASMYSIAQQLSDLWMLRSGHADGADMAFEKGCISKAGAMEIMVPWLGFNKAPTNDARYIRPKATDILAEFAGQFHPNWAKCKDTVKLMHMRNCCQILGEYGDAPVDMVICWTPGGKGGGGTGQAIRVAHHFDIPVFDLGSKRTAEDLCTFVSLVEHQSAD